MPTLHDRLTSKSLTLIASLPSNHEDVIQAAIDAEVDVIKVHMNVEHRASGNWFGTLAENERAFTFLRKHFNGPIGIVPGDAPEKVTKKELDQLQEIGFDFLSIYAHTAPAWLAADNQLEKMIALSNHYRQADLEAFKQSSADILEASIMNSETYGQRLTMNDLYHYQELVAGVSQPVVVPTQKNILIEDIQALQATGISGLMAGAIVTGKTPETIYESLKTFKEAIETERM
ncbi:hypothetical protein [Salisediminibacterium beveridgei]|uniref:Uncharacterized protein n=1 Tax=Salisediminibacterium beveridgei TaxID=632773 RepID=A0A1D7QRW4_9BACI|nr:hypothetical protein [Salisediminibacterium beveridgei]AOM81750.1 hypothetical protein BBEV_0356 [Salisediminibacterium beveridgei]